MTGSEKRRKKESEPKSRDPDKLIVPRPKRRGTPAPAEKTLPDKKKEAERRKARKKVDVSEEIEK